MIVLSQDLRQIKSKGVIDFFRFSRSGEELTCMHASLLEVVRKKTGI